MSETLFEQVLNGEINETELLNWLFTLKNHDKKLAEISTKYRCSRADFITFFLNFVHEEIGSSITDKKNLDDSSAERSKSGSELNKSHSYPLDLSSECEENATNASTPKISKVNSESILSYGSPISPIYKAQNSFTTPKNPKQTPQKSPICLGDFIINKRVPVRKKKSLEGAHETKRRIKPTNLSNHKNNTFHKSENSFNFNRSEPDEFPSERNILAEERLKILSRSDLLNVTSPKKLINPFCDNTEIKASPKLIRHKPQLDKIIKIYSDLIDNHFILNLTSEIYFLISLLLKKQTYNPDWGIEILTDRISASHLFPPIHNVVYFACKSLERQVRILRNFDKSTLRLLIENERVRDYSPDLVKNLEKIAKNERTIEIQNLQSNVCFNSDTDNRQNFPNDPSFHAFRKQRDLFYEILRIWEQGHLAPGFNFVLSLSGKIKTLLSLYNEPTNFVHFARLFKAQLLSTCRDSCENFITSLEVDAQKLSKLRSRCVTKESCEGLNSLPKFSDSEEFYRDFVLVAANHCFNRHLADALIEEIVELNDTNFNANEFEEQDDVDPATKKSYYSCIRSLRLLAKFLGFVESLPYKTECNNYSDQLLATHLKIRRQISPNFDVKTILQNSVRSKTVILCIPWLVKYLSMLDYVTLKLPYYTIVHHNLFWLYRSFDWGPDCNVYLVKFCLGWLFELAHVPDNNYLHFCDEIQNGCFNDTFETAAEMALDQLQIVDQDILYFCCPYLDEIKKILSSTAGNNPMTIKHITPITAAQSPDQLARRKLEQQLEEAFFNGQPISLRKTVEFVSERVASTCVKFICNILVPNHKKQAIEKLKAIIKIDENEDINNQKIALKTKANQLALDCLKNLQGCCDSEIETICSQKIPTAIDSLVSMDILPQTKDVCVGITKKTCIERVQQWCASHVTLGVFSKDFNDEIQKIAASENKKAKKPVFMLPPGGTNTNHNDVRTSAAHLLEKYRDLCIYAVEQNRITRNDLIGLLDETLTSIDERGDVNQCILATICTLLLDLCLLLVAHNPKLMSQDGVMSKSCDIWRLYFNGCDDLFKTLLCPRNVMIFAQSSNQTASWDAFAEFCAYLIKNKLLSCDNFESQCTGIFRTEWDKGTLKRITDFLKKFVGLYRRGGGSASDFTLLLDFFADYCEDL